VLLDATQIGSVIASSASAFSAEARNRAVNA
jgi:hypothetical protein